MMNRVSREPRFREFCPGGSARDVIAEVVARRAGRSRVAPTDWATAGAIVNELRSAGFSLRKPKP